jgi:hypothetical protein
MDFPCVGNKFGIMQVWVQCCKSIGSGRRGLLAVKSTKVGADEPII